MSKIKKIDHIGVAVNDLNEAVRQYERLGLKCARRERLEEMGLEIAFFPIGESRIELMAALRENTAIARFLVKRGPGLHHICFGVDDVAVSLKECIQKGIVAIDQEPYVGGEGRRVAFLHPKSFSGVLVELTSLSEGPTKISDLCG